MGNTQTREHRSPPSSHYPNAPPAPQNLYTAADGTVYAARPVRPAHGNIFGRSGIREEPQDEAALAQRRLNRTEREARKKEEKEAARRKERDRSMREESVDGGFLVSSGLYISDEDYSKSIVRQLMIDRRLAPFYFGLEDHRDDWAEHQLIAAVHGQDVPPADQISNSIQHWPPADGPLPASSQPSSPSADRTSFGAGETELQLPVSSSSTPLASPGFLRGHNKMSSPIKIPPSFGQSNPDFSQLETSLPPQPSYNGQRLEVFLYRNPVECEICYRSFPTYCNRSRCCDKPICSECFVSIKRKDPHPVEHDGDDSVPVQPRPVEPQNLESEFDLSEIDLVTHPAKCPFCKENEFGVTYEPPPFRTGLARSNTGSAMSRSNSMPSSANSLPGAGRKRAASIPANAPAVVTTDKIRPDWAKKLLQAKLNVAKRARAATALHQQAFLSGPSRGRLGLFRRGNSDSPNDSEEAGGSEGTPLDINRLIAAADRRMAGDGPALIVGPRGASRGYQMSVEAQYEEALQRALRESVEDERRRAEKAERERQEQEKRKAKDQAKEDKQKAKDAAKLQKANQKASKKLAGSGSSSSSFLSFPRAMRSTTSIVSSGRRSSGSVDSGKGKIPARGTPDDATTPGAGLLSSSSQAHLSAPSQSKESSRPSTARATPPSKTRDTRSSSQTNFSSLNAMVGKQKEATSSEATGAEESSGLGSFASDIMSSMNDIMKTSSEPQASEQERRAPKTSSAGASGTGEATSSSVEPKRHEMDFTSEPITREYGSV